MSDFELLAAREQVPLDNAPFHQWTSGETVLITFHRTPAGYLLRFPGIADFEIEVEKYKVLCTPVLEVPPATCDHIYLNQVLPLLLARSGELVLHGSGVVVEGKAVVFVGESGCGKSTLAAAFSVDGQPFLSDDTLVLRPSADGYTVMPGHPSIRLWEDSHEALLPLKSSVAPAVYYTSKARFLAGETLEYFDRPAVLRCAYFLGDSGFADIQIRQIGPSDAVAIMLKHSFILDIQDRQLLASQFDKIAKIVDAIDCYRLDYPRCYARLDELKECIRDHAETIG